MFSAVLKRLYTCRPMFLSFSKMPYADLHLHDFGSPRADYILKHLYFTVLHISSFNTAHLQSFLK
jgi:hypothetical protein